MARSGAPSVAPGVFSFREDEQAFRAWARGETGYPVVDAGMRQLWRTGFIQPRADDRGLLVKHLLIDWRRGEAWFWHTLCDADPASNPLGWQWVAGSGADAAPFFRIFNPVLQGEKFAPTAPMSAAGSRSSRIFRHRASTRHGGRRAKRSRRLASPSAGPTPCRSSTMLTRARALAAFAENGGALSYD